MPPTPETRPSNAELRRQLHRSTQERFPFIWSERVGEAETRDELDRIAEVLSGDFLDDILEEVLAGLPRLRSQIDSSLPAGIAFRAAPTNSINALTVPTSDGVTVILNLGLYSILGQMGGAVSGIVSDNGETREDRVAFVVNGLVDVADWSTCLARAQRRVPMTSIPFEDGGLGVNMAARANRFAVCHELGHVAQLLDDQLLPEEESTRSVLVDELEISGVSESWEKEFDADSRGLSMYLDVLAAQDDTPASALIGAVLFLTGSGLLQGCSYDEQRSHPPAFDRLERLWMQFCDVFEADALDLVRPASVVLSTMSGLDKRVVQEVWDRRARVEREFEAQFAVGLKSWPALDRQGRLEASRRMSRLLVASPGATLECLNRRLARPLQPDEMTDGSPERLLAMNVANHFVPEIRSALKVVVR